MGFEYALVCNVVSISMPLAISQIKSRSAFIKTFINACTCRI